MGRCPGPIELLYLAWARESGESVLAADPYDLTGPHSVLAPVYLLSGLQRTRGSTCEPPYGSGSRLPQGCS